MTTLNLPPCQLNIREEDGRKSVFDTLRHRYVSLTPEEWVRQHFVRFLIGYKGYPPTLLANEVSLRIGSKTLRADSVLYSSSLHPRMIIEYKAPTVEITRKVFDQIAAYNMLLHADYLIVSNGMQHYCCKVDYEKREYSFLKNIPEYKDL